MIAESDSESVPSPRKRPGGRISSCKTYEEIRLEEIQAESAAFYSLGPNEERTSEAGKAERPLATTKAQRVAASPYARDKIKRTDPDEMDFQVLSLEEIRRRKKTERPVEVVRPLENEAAARLTVIPVDEEQKVESTKIDQEPRLLERRKKRSFVEEPKVNSGGGARVAPIRLKRLRLAISKDGDVAADAIKAKEEEERRAKERLEEASKRQAVEVRMCDSSTDDNQSDESPAEKDKRLIDDLDESQFSMLTPVCDSAAKLDKSRLLSIDNEDDILKDIDALLTDDATS